MVVLSHLLVFFVSGTSPAYGGWYWAFPTDGNLAVFIFFVLSGFALSIGYIQTRRMSLITSLCARRYLRLAIPILFASLLAYLLLSARLFYNIDAGNAIGNSWLARFYGFAPGFYDSVKFGLYGVFVSSDVTLSYNPILWTMPIELFGSFIVFAICALFLHLKKRLLFIAAILLYFVLTRNIYYLSFIVGICIALCYHHREKPVFRKFRFVVPLLLAGAVYYSTVSLRGRGADAVLIQGAVRVKNSHGLLFERVNFKNEVMGLESAEFSIPHNALPSSAPTEHEGYRAIQNYGTHYAGGGGECQPFFSRFFQGRLYSGALERSDPVPCPEKRGYSCRRGVFRHVSRVRRRGASPRPCRDRRGGG